jgi:hypothetical protein
MSDSTELAEVSSIRSGGWEAGRRIGVSASGDTPNTFPLEWMAQRRKRRLQPLQDTAHHGGQRPEPSLTLGPRTRPR